MMMQEVSDHNAEIYVNEPFDFEKSHLIHILLLKHSTETDYQSFVPFVIQSDQNHWHVHSSQS